jgi:hypothetical protein
MKRLVIFCVLVSAVCLSLRQDSKKWGFFGHKQINRMAVFTLPPDMIGFYKHYIDFITAHAVDPDKRRYAIEGEAQRHYIDIDHYAKKGADPFKEVPHRWKPATEKFTEDTLQAYGIVPWHIEVMAYRLTAAFKEEDPIKILKTSADIGHYVADAHVPLHTTENYNGQLTGQKGIHGFWESRIPELFYKEYNFFVDKALYIKNINDFAWNVVKESHAEVDSVLQFEKKLSREYDSDKKYAYENRGRVLVQVYSEEYTRKYSDAMNNMVERKMRKAIIAVGSIWYTAWVNAGQPDLNKLLGRTIQDEDLNEGADVDTAYSHGKKTKGLNCENEE